MKKQLITLINAYGAARATGDQVLIKLAGDQLQAFLASVDLTEIQPAAD
jgi:hypothetical protein